jgi:hypothetical protein
VSGQTARLAAELRALLGAAPGQAADRAAVLELVIAADLRANAAVRRCVGEHARPLVPDGAVGWFAELRQATGESGAVWAARVDRVLGLALAHKQPADPAAVALVRARVL